MIGTEKQIAWAEKIRAKFVREAKKYKHTAEEIAAVTAEESAKFWIDNRDAGPTALIVVKQSGKKYDGFATVVYPKTVKGETEKAVKIEVEKFCHVREDFCPEAVFLPKSQIVVEDGKVVAMKQWLAVEKNIGYVL